MADTTDLLGLAIEKNPVDFADTLNQMLQQKAQSAVEAHRVTLAQSIYGEEDTTDDVEDAEEDEFEFSEDELDDLGDEEDLDLDLEDLDLDDLDLDDDYEDNTDAEDA
jgi:hypothetical protein